ncbi:MAG: hypothetical protein JXJ18_11480, partial [Rhodobacteraceae bacterium]|nr:hypothetical protein [Paracoccaceae bacterium]
MADIFERYRYVHPDGTAKDWAVRDNGDGTLTTRWGKAGDRLPQRHTRPYRHPGEVNALIRQKRNKGYCPLDRVRIDKHGRVSAASAEDTPKTEDAMYWEVHFIASGEEPALQRRIARLIDTLARYACVDSRADPPTLNGWAVPSPDNRAGQLR